MPFVDWHQSNVGDLNSTACSNLEWQLLTLPQKDYTSFANARSQSDKYPNVMEKKCNNRLGHLCLDRNDIMQSSTCSISV